MRPSFNLPTLGNHERPNPMRGELGMQRRAAPNSSLSHTVNGNVFSHLPPLHSPPEKTVRGMPSFGSPEIRWNSRSSRARFVLLRRGA